MPYARNEDLPDSVKNVLPKRAQSVWRRVVNTQLKKGTKESSAFAIGWTAVKNGWDKNESTGKWTRKVSAEAFAGGCMECGWGDPEWMDASDDDDAACAFCGANGDDDQDAEKSKKGKKRKDDQDDGDSSDDHDEPLTAVGNYQTRGGKQFHKGDFFYTPSDQPGTWKLLKSGTPGGKPDAAHVGAAIAALGKGFRGKKVQIPAADRARVKAKVRGAWRTLHPGAKAEDIPAAIRASAKDLEATNHAFSTVQLVLDDTSAAMVRQVAATMINPDDVHLVEGLEARPHITVLYGLETDNVADVVPLIPHMEMIEAIVQGVEVFQPEGKDYDVLVHRVSSPGAIALRNCLTAALPYVTTQPWYKPHITLGYVRRGQGGQYVGMHTALEGTVLQFYAVEFNTPDNVATTIPLEGKEEAATREKGMDRTGWVFEAMGVELPSLPGHPNRMPFTGVLTRVDEPSDKAPIGAKGHRVLMPRAVAEVALPSLIGMGVNSAQGFATHNPQRKIGVITEAWLHGQDLHVLGVLYARDFPQVVEEIQALARRGSLGMSFELAAVEVEQPEAPIWRLRSCTFTGAAILQRAHAAYRGTALAAGEEDDDMDKTTLLAAMDRMSDVMSGFGSLQSSLEVCIQTMHQAPNVQAQVDRLVAAFEKFVSNGPVVPVGATTTITGESEGETMDAETKARLEAMETKFSEMSASIKLLTDSQVATNALITDKLAGFVGLITDSREVKAANGAPKRRTLHAQGEYELAIVKYGLEKDKGYSEREIDVVLRNAGVTDIEKRMAVKMELEACGALVRQRA